MATYTIKLNLGGDIISRLTQANALMSGLEQKAGRISNRSGGAGGVGGMRYANLRGSWHERANRMYDVSRRFGNRHSREDFLSDTNRAFGSIRRVREQFVRNSFTPSGWMRNAGNMVGAVFDVAASVIKSNPALMAGAGLAGIAAAGYAVPKLVGGLLYSTLSKTLNSASMTDAISNRMQMDMAQKGLGSSYSTALSDATRMAAEYGYSRAGMLSMINTVSGFEIGGEEIGTEIATDIARMVGKVSQLGGRPYDVVGLNMQQLLAADKPNLRDVRELIHAAPILNRYANEDMKRRGVTDMSPYNYLQDRGNMLRALYRLDSELQPPSASAARGRIALAKENFWINVAGMDKLWESVGRAGESMFDRLSARISIWFQEFDVKDLDHVFDEFVDGAEDVVSALLSLSQGILNVSDFFSSLNPFNWGEEKRYERDWRKDVEQYNIAERRKGVESITEQFANKFIDNYLSDPNVRKNWGLDEGTSEAQAQTLKETRDILLRGFKSRYSPIIANNITESDGALPESDSIPQYVRTYYDVKRKPVFDKPVPMGVGVSAWWGERETYNPTKLKADVVPRTLRPAPDFNINLDEITKFFDKYGKLFGGAGDSGSDTKKIEDLTKGSKSLIVNFNAPIVQMPTQITTTASAESIMQTLSRQIEEVTIRGLQMAFNNSTRMLQHG